MVMENSVVENTEKEQSSSKLLHDIVSHTSTILSISQMAIFTWDGMTDEMRSDIERIMETAHAIVDNAEQLGELLEKEER